MFVRGNYRLDPSNAARLVTERLPARRWNDGAMLLALALAVLGAFAAYAVDATPTDLAA